MFQGKTVNLQESRIGFVGVEGAPLAERHKDFFIFLFNFHVFLPVTWSCCDISRLLWAIKVTVSA